MRAFKTKKKQIQEEKDKRYIKIPIPERFYCMEHKIYETPQDFNEEVERRNRASERIGTAYETGKKEAAREILKFIEDYGFRSIRDKNYGSHYKLTDYMIANIKHKYGIELEGKDE